MLNRGGRGERLFFFNDDTVAALWLAKDYPLQDSITGRKKWIHFLDIYIDDCVQTSEAIIHQQRAKARSLLFHSWEKAERRR